MPDWTNVDSRQVASVQYTVPTTGTTVAINSGGNVTLLINPAGTLLALTVTLSATPGDGDIVTIASSQVITGLTISGGTVIGALTTMAVGTFASYTYNAISAKWWRIG